MVTQMEEVVDQSQSQSQSSSQDYKEENELPSVETEENVVKFLDSVDGYLMLMDSLNSTLRQGWLELASARHSMGASRINSALFDLKDHSAATTFEVHLQCEEPVFKLHKWASSDSSKGMSGEATFADGKLLPTESNGPVMSQNSTSENSDIQEKKGENNGSPAVVHDQVQKQRIKTLSMFGALFSPKLRAAQLSFETALETLLDIANMRASLLAAYEQVHESTRK